jgi:Xaa-Pro aminopeptidase
VNVPLSEFRRRRERLMEMLPEGTLAIVPGATLRRRNRDVDYLFRQDSDFYYLTGFTEEDALLVMVPGREHGETILFCQERDARYESYNGERLGPERAHQMLGVDDAFPVSDAGDILPGLLEGRERVYLTLGEYPEFDKQLMHWVTDIRARESGGVVAPGEFVSLKHLLHELRLFKSAKELGMMREAARITAEAHIRAMQACRPGLNELDLEAELTYHFMRNGARSPAYPSIVASGANACVLHYIDNRAALRKGELVLIDAGCEYEHYAADLTRTFPVTGQYTDVQKAVYEVVLAAQKAAIDRCRVGEHFNAPHDAALAVMIEGLIDLKLLSGTPAEVLEKGTYQRFCPHKSSHWLGLDVHDVGDYRIDGAWRELEAGMVLTVEPGIYIRDDEVNAGLARKWRGLGVRIEDDVLVTRKDPEVLTAAAPKEIAEVEAVMAG